MKKEKPLTSKKAEALMAFYITVNAIAILACFFCIFASGFEISDKVNIIMYSILAVLLIAAGITGYKAEKLSHIIGDLDDDPDDE